MQTKNRLLDDLARLLNGAAGVAATMTSEANAQVRQRLERWFAGFDFVPREEFEAIKELAAAARASGEALAERVSWLERKLGKKPAAKPQGRTKRRAKAAPRKTRK